MNIINRAMRLLYQNEWVLLSIILVCALALRIHVLHLPGPNADELLDAFQAERLRLGDPLWIPTFRIAAYSLPAGFNGYQGAFPIYVHWLISKFTDQPLRFRYINVLYDLGSICFLYLFTRTFISKRAALLIAAFQATMPSPVFFSRIGAMVTYMRIMFASAVLFCFYRWSTRRDWGAFYFGCLVLGLGISTRLEIIWWPIAATAYFILLDRSRLKEELSAFWTHKRKALVGAACFLVGSSLFIAFNVVTHGGTFSEITQNLVRTDAGHTNLEFLKNLGERVKHLVELLDGSSIWGMSLAYKNILFSVTFGLAFLTTLIVALVARLRGQVERRIEFLAFMLVFMLLESTFSLSTLKAMHLLILLPVPLLILVKFLDMIPWKSLVALTAAALVAGNIWVDIRYYDSLRRFPGQGGYSTRIYSFVEELQRAGVSRVIACDWGLARHVYYFSKGRIKVKEIWGDSHNFPASFYLELELAAAFQEPSTSFLFFASPWSTGERERAFLDYLRERGLTYDQRVFYDDYGPIYLVYQVPRQNRPVDRVADSGRAAGLLAGLR